MGVTFQTKQNGVSGRPRITQQPSANRAPAAPPVYRPAGTVNRIQPQVPGVSAKAGVRPAQSVHGPAGRGVSLGVRPNPAPGPRMLAAPARVNAVQPLKAQKIVTARPPVARPLVSRYSNAAQADFAPGFKYRPGGYRGAPSTAQQKPAASHGALQPKLPPGVEAFQVSLRQRPGGWALPKEVQAKMEEALGADFSDVRIHVGPEVSAIGAIAFTWGSNIHFAPGYYSPHTPHGQQLLAHELTHVVQQRAGRVRNPYGNGVAVVQDAALEAEADRMGRRAVAPRMETVKTSPRVAQRTALVQPFAAHRGGLQPSRGARVAQLCRERGAGQMNPPRGGAACIVQRSSLGEIVVGGIRGRGGELANLSAAIGSGNRTNLANALLDPAYDVRGAVDLGTFALDVADPLNFASCYPTAQHLFPLLTQAVREGGVLRQGANRDTYASGADFRRQVELLIGVMQSAAADRVPYVFRIEFAGHGFTLVSTLGGHGGTYQFELIESLAHSAAIVSSLVSENRIFTPVQIYQNLRDMASDNVDTRLAGALAMGWNGNALYLGRDATHGGRIDFPAVRMKWWAAKLSRQWNHRWAGQIRDRFNFLAERYGIEDRI